MNQNTKANYETIAGFTHRQSILVQQMMEATHLVIMADEGERNIANTAAASRRLYESIVEMVNEFGPATAGGLFREILAYEEQQCGIPHKESSREEIAAILLEMEAQEREQN